jgi:hypothetical protein
MEDNNINNIIIEKIDKIFKNIDIDKYIDYKIISTHNWNDNFINNYIKYIIDNDYDKILEESINLCSLSYFLKDYVNIILKNINVIYSDDHNKSKYFIIHNKERNNIIITFRGTSYLSDAVKGLQYYRTKFDFITDSEKDKFINWRNKNIYKNKYFDPLRVPLKDDIDIEIHKGYYNESLNMLYSLMDNLFKIIKNQKTNIVFLGHSMGILSSIVALLFKIKLSEYELLKDNLNNIKIFNITVNSPTIGNKNYNLLKFYYGIEKTIQFYNYQDKLISYGYYDTFFDKRKIRHTDYMLKGIYATVNKKFFININYGKNLDKIYEEFNDKKQVKNKILFFHSLFKIPSKKKLLHI